MRTSSALTLSTAAYHSCAGVVRLDFANWNKGLGVFQPGVRPKDFVSRVAERNLAATNRGKPVTGSQGHANFHQLRSGTRSFFVVSEEPLTKEFGSCASAHAQCLEGKQETMALLNSGPDSLRQDATNAPL